MCAFDYKVERFSGIPRWGLHTPDGMRWYYTKKAALAMAETLRREQSVEPAPGDSGAGEKE